MSGGIYLLSSVAKGSIALSKSKKAKEFIDLLKGTKIASKTNDKIDDFEKWLKGILKPNEGVSVNKGVSNPEFSELNNVYSNIEEIRSGNKSLVYDERTLRRMSEDGGAYHNIPTILDESIMSGEPYVIRANEKVEFLKKGSVGTISAKTNKYSVKKGIYHMTIEGNSVKHKLFVPEEDWDRFAKRWGLPGYDLID